MNQSNIITTSTDIHWILREKCTNISQEEFSKYEKILQEMAVYVRWTNKAIWLALPQIWYPKNWFVISCRDWWWIYINPSFETLSDGKDIMEEWCLSEPWVKIQVSRYIKIKATYTNVKWKEVTTELNGLMARVFQHEYDHLQWVLIQDKNLADEVLSLNK